MKKFFKNIVKVIGWIVLITLIIAIAGFCLAGVMSLIHKQTLSVELNNWLEIGKNILIKLNLITPSMGV